jgi:hypothetical protein
MAAIAVHISTSYNSAAFDAKLNRLIAASSRPLAGPAGTEAIRAVRDVISSEFARGGYFNTSGGFVRWKEGHDFGKRKAKHPVLGGPGGRLGRSWLGGPGGYSKTLGGGVGVEIGTHLPWASVHRGGNPVRVNRVTLIRPRKRASGSGSAMRWYLGLNLGIWLSERRLARGLAIPARPHALGSPQVAKAVSGVVRSFLKKAAR